jgi:hypothetical protein
MNRKRDAFHVPDPGAIVIRNSAMKVIGQPIGRRTLSLRLRKRAFEGGIDQITTGEEGRRRQERTSKKVELSHSSERARRTQSGGRPRKLTCESGLC